MVSGIIYDIKRYAIHDGPGIRTTVFLKGCPLDCWWCHNPESRAPEPQTIVRGEASHQREERAGYEIAPLDLIRQIERDELFFDESGGGVTFSGGEPLYQPAFLLEMLRLAKKREIHVALDTTGYARWDVIEPVAPFVDLWLYDLKHLDDERHRRFCGVGNVLILENLRKLDEAGAVIELRLPVVPGVNDGLAYYAELAGWIRSLRRQPGVRLLPYHRIASGKYRGLGMEYRMPDVLPPARPVIDGIRAELEAGGVAVLPDT